MKRLLFISAILLIASSMFTSCRTYYSVSKASDYTNAYVGKSHNDIVYALGAPDRQTSDGSGGTILIYEDFTTQSVATAHNVNYYTGTYTPGARSTTHTDYAHFYIGSNGKCYNVKTNHTKTVSKFAPGKTIFLGLGCALPVISLLVGLLAGN
jgi:hypothetical protein